MINSDKVIVNLAPTGVIPNKKMTSFVPVTPTEVATDIEACLSTGLTIVHLHARDELEEHTAQPEMYAKYIEAIREKSQDLILCVSCSGRKDPSFETRSQVLNLTGDVRPDLASLTLSSLNFTRSSSINTPETVVRLAEKMQENGIKPELEVFDLGMVNYAKYLISKGYLTPPYYFNIILGNIASAQASLLHLGTIINELPDNSFWSVGGIGHAQLPANMMAISQGGGVRIGLEDNIWYDTKRTKLATNKSLLDRVATAIILMDKKIMTAKELRSHLLT